MKPHIRAIACCLISCVALALAGCGNKGALTLPAKPADHSSPPAAASK